MKMLPMLGALASFALYASPSSAHPESATAILPDQCNALAHSDFSRVQDAPTQITEARWVTANTDIPAHCRVQGYVAPQVGFDIRMPEHWNRKLLMIGCGGYCGGLSSQDSVCDAPLRNGYACVVSDMGHRSNSIADGLWAYNNLQAKIDFGYRATHVATLAGKAITEETYRSAPDRSYFFGCSTGGRQALVSAQRFPWDFDGIIAGDPPVDYSMPFVYALGTTITYAGPDGTPLLTQSALQLLHEAGLAKCDLSDGLKDGIIANPRSCRFDPGELACKAGKGASCLTDAQVAAARKVYAGVSTPTGELLYPGAAVGSELNWNGSFGGDLEQHFVTAFQYLRFMPDAGPTWKVADFDARRDYKRFGMADALSSASNPDLRKFKAAGGKLLMYGGWNDTLITPGSVIDYYETVERTMGGRKVTQDFLRLFMIPGMNHCTGGDGAYAVDYLSYLEAWVEKGEAPNKLIGAHLKPEDPGRLDFPLDPARIQFSRPVYPYPSYAKYLGHGDPNSAASFGPVEP